MIKLDKKLITKYHYNYIEILFDFVTLCSRSTNSFEKSRLKPQIWFGKYKTFRFKSYPYISSTIIRKTWQ